MQNAFLLNSSPLRTGSCLQWCLATRKLQSRSLRKETSPDGEVLRSFDIEMQMEDNEDIPKRTRYYQAMCDSEALNKGEVYYKLNDLYIMFPHRG